MASPRPSVNSLLWPPSDSKKALRLVRMPALIFACFGAVLWTIIAIAGFFTPNRYGPLAIVAALLLILISIGLYKMRREAAIAAFVTSLIGLIYDWGRIKMISEILLLAFAIVAIRATFAYASAVKNGKFT